MNYAKGKWEQSGSIILVYGEEGGIICQMAEYRPKSGLVEFHPIEISDPHWGIQIANANLIAAAPDMYEFCRELLFSIDTGYERLGAGREGTLREVVAKAEGKEER